MAVPPDDTHDDLNERTLIDQSVLDEAPAPPKPSAAEREPDPPAADTLASGGDEDDEDEATRMIDVLADETPVAPAPRPTVGEAHLVCVAGKDLGRSFPISDASTLVGRGLDCTIILNDPSVSRRHFNILRTPDGYRLVDLGSGNGTRLNGVVVPENSLEEGGLIEIGVTTLRFGLGPAPVADPRPAPTAPGAAPPPPVVPQQPAQGRTAVDMPAASDSKGGGLGKILVIAAIVVGVVIVFLAVDKLVGLGVVFSDSGAEAAKLHEEALVLLEDEQWAEAEKLLEQVKSLDPEREGLKKQIRQAHREARAQSDWEDALDAKEAGELAEARASLESISEKSAYYERAQEMLEEIGEKAPEKPPADPGQAAIEAFNQKRFAEAEKAFRESGATARADAVAGFVKAFQDGAAMARESRHAEAVTALEEALRQHMVVGGGLETEVRSLLVGALVARAQHALGEERFGDAGVDVRRAYALDSSEPRLSQLRSALVSAADQIEQNAKDRLNENDMAGAIKIFEVLVWLFPDGHPKHEFAKGFLPQ